MAAARIAESRPLRMRPARTRQRYAIGRTWNRAFASTGPLRCDAGCVRVDHDPRGCLPAARAAPACCGARARAARARTRRRGRARRLRLAARAARRRRLPARPASRSRPPIRSAPGRRTGLAGAQAVAVSPDGSSVYVAGEDAVVALARDPRSAGRCIPRSRRPRAHASAPARAARAPRRTPRSSGADALAVSPDGRFVYVGASNTATVSAFAAGATACSCRSRRASRGMPAASPAWRSPACRSPDAALACHALNGVDALAISPDGRYLYAVSYGLEPGQDSVVTLQRDPRSGGLRPLPGTRGCVQSLPGKRLSCARRPRGRERDHDLPRRALRVRRLGAERRGQGIPAQSLPRAR